MVRAGIDTDLILAYIVERGVSTVRIRREKG
jgi:hypothetical protein